jgi:hypothetical protein
MADEDGTGSAEVSRRAFLKKMAMVGFAVPIVTSFALDGVASAEVIYKKHSHGNQTFPNQTFPNQLLPVQALPNQSELEEVDLGLSQLFGNQTRI